MIEKILSGIVGGLIVAILGAMPVGSALASEPESGEQIGAKVFLIFRAIALVMVLTAQRAGKALRLLLIMSNLLAFALPFSQAKAKEEISGAFGVTLGQLFDPTTAIGKAFLTDGTPMYQFRAKKKFRSFSRYYVLITPKTHRVYAIWGIGNIENTATCKKEQELLMAILKDKYGEKEKEDLFSNLYDIKMITQGDRYVVTKCSGLFDAEVEIRYKDSEYEKSAENERIEIERKELDSSGL